MKGHYWVLTEVEVGKMIQKLDNFLRDIIKRELIPKQF